MTIEEKRNILFNHCGEHLCKECELFGVWSGDSGLQCMPITTASEEELDWALKLISYKPQNNSIIITNCKVYGLEDSIKASKYPMAVDIDKCTSEITERTKVLAQCDTGTGHDQFLTGIIVQFDLAFTIKAWTEAERYHFFDFVSSQSTMHRITKFDVSKQCIKYVRKKAIENLEECIADYNADPTPEKYLEVVYNVPVGFKLTARMTTNYRQLKTIYQQRKTHRLPEWKVFCEWIEGLPYSGLITGKNF